MTYKLFLDDERFPEDVTWIVIDKGPWVIVRTQDAFEHQILHNGCPDVISFDNDLGDGFGEGRYCARWLVDQWLDETVDFNPEFAFTVHSKNNIAAEAISSKLNQYMDFRIGEQD